MRTGNDLIVNGELILSGSVLLDSWIGWMWDEDVFFAPSMVRDALGKLGEGRVTVRLNSDGGHADAGEQIRAILASHPGGCRIIVEGIAASSASLIFMAGAERLMSAGSHLMIHDPSGAIWGNEAEARRQAEQLAIVSNTYAAVYAAASGKTAEECRAIMQAETWFGPDAAIANGFADAVAPEAVTPPPAIAPAPSMALATARQAYMSANDKLRQRIAAHGTPERAARPASNPAQQGEHNKETNMSIPTNPVTPTAPVAPPLAPTAPTMANPAEALAQERNRVKGLREMAAPHIAAGRIMQADLDAMIDDGVSIADAGTKILATMARNEPAGRTNSPHATINRDETDTKMEGMIGALMGKSDGPSQMYRGMRLRHLAMELGGTGRGYNDTENIRRGMVSTTMMGGATGVSDFAYITTQVMGRTLLDSYTRRAALWQLVTGAPQTATDFRELNAVRFGGDFALKTVKENGEYQEATLSDEAEGLKVERRGRKINLTFEAVVNDDMGAFTRIPNEFAMAARQMENQMVWALFRNNAKLKSDGKSLFHADHKNLAAVAAAISITSVAAGRKAFLEQRQFGSKDSDDFIYVEPDRLIVPPALELTALQFATNTMPTEDGKINPYKSTLTPAVVPNLGAVAGGSDTAWYLVSSDAPPISHAYLDGYAAPTVQTVDGMNPDTVVMTARHIFGAAAVDAKGAYKNAGV